MVTVIGVPFVAKGEDGDYEWMVKQSKYKRTLFIIQENVIDAANEKDAGAGTAVLRPFTFRYKDVPRAAGIPTGWSVRSGAFTRLNFFSKRAINIAVERIHRILHDHDSITQIVFSCSSDDTTLIGQGVFKIPLPVIMFISQKIQALATKQTPTHTHEEITAAEVNFLEHAYAIDIIAKQTDEIRILKRKLLGSSDAVRMCRLR